MDELPAWGVLADLAAQMAASAETADWDRLIVTGQVFDRQLALIRSSPAQPLTATEAREKARLITAIRDHQQAVRTHVEPWLAQVRPLLATLSPGAVQATDAQAG